MSVAGKELALSDELAALERALTSLTPATPGIDRDRLMFLAGRRSVASSFGRAWVWPMTAAAMTLLAVGLWLRDLPNPAPALAPGWVESQTSRTFPRATSAATSAGPTEYFQLSRSALRTETPEIADIPHVLTSEPVGDVSVFQLRRELLRGETAEEPLF